MALRFINLSLTEWLKAKLLEASKNSPEVLIIAIVFNTWAENFRGHAPVSCSEPDRISFFKERSR